MKCIECTPSYTIMGNRESQFFIYVLTYMSCVYLNRILPGIIYGQTTFTILKPDKLSMLDISPFSIKFDNGVTNNTFPIGILREKNHKKNASICYTCTQFISEVKLLKNKQRISSIDLLIIINKIPYMW